MMTKEIKYTVLYYMRKTLAEFTQKEISDEDVSMLIKLTMETPFTSKAIVKTFVACNREMPRTKTVLGAALIANLDPDTLAIQLNHWSLL